MPDDADCWMLLAQARRKSGDIDGALEAVSSALLVEPGHRLAWSLKLACLKVQRRTQDLRDFLRDSPAHLLAREDWLLLIESSLQLGSPLDAVQACLQALTRSPHDAMLNYWMGLGFAELGLKAHAIECLRTALLLDLGPREAGVRDLLAFYERQVCNWAAAQAEVRRLEQAVAALSPDDAVCTSPFTHATLLDDPHLQLVAARARALHTAKGLRPLQLQAPQRRSRLRLGYVSADFHRHATSYLMAEMLERHDRSRFEVCLYSLGRGDDSKLRRRLEACAGSLVDASGMRTFELAARIREDGIDILVDLKGYTKEARPAVFALRPAPVQVAYLGFPGTCGAPWIDYIVGDRVVTPLQDAAHFSEKIAQMPGSYQCNDGTRALPATVRRVDVGLPEQGLVLCGFNEAYKISPEVFDVWCRLLLRLPGSVLWLLQCDKDATAALWREAAERGIDTGRLLFAPKVPSAQHLDRLGCADLFLDTWPCNGHTTASDMLWGGVPVITCAGRTFASRVAASLLHAAGLPELICGDPVAYENLVFDLASDPGRLSALRQRVQQARLHSELFSGAAAARGLEALYERMWERALAGLPPDHLPAAAYSRSAGFALT